LDYSKLSKEVSYALRHAPWEYELELNSEGWVDIEQLLLAICIDKKWESITESNLRKMIDISDKKRHEIWDGKIRALYGHCTSKNTEDSWNSPFDSLSWDSEDLVEQILTVGLQPMGRQYVHLSVDIDTANLVGKRKDSNPVLLKIEAEKASNEGIKFYQGNNAVWLANCIHLISFL
jgi:putative RNA 2'-phosphotransferase